MFLPAGNSKVKGFTLIEVMVAVLVLSVGLMALIQTLGYAISFNFSNKLRNDAIMVAGRAMGHERSRPFEQISSVKSTVKIPFALSFANYSVRKNVDPLGSNSKMVQFDVSWRDKQVKKHHYLSTTITNGEEP
ncbi:MAG: hypothetical protein A2X80_10250 [Geobacteraceae bacterium GWB2_52_12]|nr:MAG: hypothetical protein A2X80_10250 [Geobacteraceae bacterium GWB2_52_12]